MQLICLKTVAGNDSQLPLSEDSTAKMRWSRRAKRCQVDGWYPRKGDWETQCLIRMEVSYKRQQDGYKMRRIAAAG